MAAELGSYKQAHTSSPPLTLGNSRVVEGPAPLKELGSRAQAMRGGPPPRLLPKPHCTGPSWIFLRVVSLLDWKAGPRHAISAELSPAGSRGQRPGKDQVTKLCFCEPQPQAWLQEIYGEGIYNILGDALEFSATKSCQKIGSKLEKQPNKCQRARLRLCLVARWDEVWKPATGYTDRMSPNTSVIFNTSNILDGGVYKLTCGHSTTMTLVQVEIKIGEKYKERASVSPDWRTQGDFSVTLQGVRLEDQGDYFFFTATEDGRKTEEKLAAVRMKVMKPHPPLQPTERKEENLTIGIIVLGITALVFPAIIFFVMSSKYRRSRGERPEPGMELKPLPATEREDLTISIVLGITALWCFVFFVTTIVFFVKWRKACNERPEPGVEMGLVRGPERGHHGGSPEVAKATASVSLEQN
ncbi:hypothetical protein L3Q82_003925 [Scortum barcoo]|uniref:Uncharacterized protein n=1 Tax=Scortum barcoo TaxID=214431 RepID=A0ACB8X6F3_9TELE|nr:hypothetical protein L3Q82_003925 [Scortum barcoo]